MKIVKQLLFFLACIAMLTTCTNSDDILEDNSQINSDYMKYKVPTDAIVVAPSGDISGVTDANNIEDELSTAKLTGGTVYLSDENKKTTDYYYISRNIVVDGFKGTLMGEGKNKTIINAGRKSASEGFEPAYSPIWTDLKPWEPLAPNVLQMGNCSGDVTIKNLSILVKDDQPTDIQLDFYGDDGSYIWTIIELMEGEYNTRIENVRLEGKKSLANGNIYGLNAGWGIIRRPGINGELDFVDAKGNLTIKNVEIKNVSQDAIRFIGFIDGSNINITDVSVENVGTGITAGYITDSFVDISNVSAENVGIGIDAGDITDSFFNISKVDISIHEDGWAGMYFYNINSGLKVTKNQITGAKWFTSLYMRNVSHSTISKNKFIDISSFGAAIYLRSESNENTLFQNDFKDSTLPGWTTTSPDGPGAILLRFDTQNNDIFEMKFPKNEEITLCEMILDNGNNKIKNWEACKELGYKSSAVLNEEPSQDYRQFRIKHTK